MVLLSQKQQNWKTIWREWKKPKNVTIISLVANWVIFTTVDYIGQGLPILLPNGARVIQQLARFVEDEEERRGYLLTKTPFLAKK